MNVKDHFSEWFFVVNDSNFAMALLDCLLKKLESSQDGSVSSSYFDLYIKVKPEHIDVLGHVNNVVYVQWMQDVATAHIENLGVGLNQYLELKHAMVAVEHHVQYRKAALLGEDLILRTWLYDINALYSFRQYAFFKASDKSLLFTGNTKWACIEIATGRPKRMSPTFIQAYQPMSTEIDPFKLN